MVPGQTGALDAEATGGIAGRNIEHRGAPHPSVATGLAEYAGGGSGSAT